MFTTISYPIWQPESWLRHFYSSRLLMRLRRQWMKAQVVGSLPHTWEQMLFFKNRARHDGSVDKSSPWKYPDHMGASSGLRSSTFHPSPWVPLERAVKNSSKPWDPRPEWETRKKLLALESKLLMRSRTFFCFDRYWSGYVKTKTKKLQCSKISGLEVLVSCLEDTWRFHLYFGDSIYTLPLWEIWPLKVTVMN